MNNTAEETTKVFQDYIDKYDFIKIINNSDQFIEFNDNAISARLGDKTIKSLSVKVKITDPDVLWESLNSEPQLQTAMTGDYRSVLAKMSKTDNATKYLVFVGSIVNALWSDSHQAGEPVYCRPGLEYDSFHIF